MYGCYLWHKDALDRSGLDHYITSMSRQANWPCSTRRSGMINGVAMLYRLSWRDTIGLPLKIKSDQQGTASQKMTHMSSLFPHGGTLAISPDTQHIYLLRTEHHTNTPSESIWYCHLSSDMIWQLVGGIFKHIHNLKMLPDGYTFYVAESTMPSSRSEELYFPHDI
jgi:hypothetical protein